MANRKFKPGQFLKSRGNYYLFDSIASTGMAGFIKPIIEDDIDVRSKNYRRWEPLSYIYKYYTPVDKKVVYANIVLFGESK